MTQELNAEKILKDTAVKSFYQATKLAANIYDEGYVLDLDKAEPLREFMFSAVDHINDTREQGKLMSYMENEFLTYLLTTRKWGTSLENDPLNIHIKRLFTGESSLARRLSTYKQDPVLGNNFLIDQLIPIINPDRSGTDNIRLFDKEKLHLFERVMKEMHEKRTIELRAKINEYNDLFPDIFCKFISICIYIMNYYNIDRNLLYFDDKGDGGCKNDKYKRDINILETALINLDQ